MTPLFRVANALMTAILVVIAGFGAFIAVASGNGVPLLVALVVVGAGVALGRVGR